ncbi:LOW QUALITY PROTEIN: mediator of RNA polymerase II transcription subunit 13-like [Pecten maximus]|uniref:LOW QUALITY PROTEIN: mediator of RNA polymerase II transcription subunit 13-like n=1 Tax=Pecten maximus TaxID=6579 RepID=UPI001458252F|nr:LOW QUALITY PROTEIN: mediator of RNA polymerase II transcription subunit 13-like [Pecten maximus]
MNHPNPSGNGCSLEDCYANIFALTDICGIKWRKLTAKADYSPNTVDHLEDPVLESYSRCIQADILCVWRRVQRYSDQPQRVIDQLSHHKELWIFWYGDEPSVLGNLLSPYLDESEHGSWDKDKDKDKDNSLSYECRTLLFKALHNLIEKCLLSKGFARLGRWFVQPFDSTQANTERGTHLSFSFNFFLHGESSVCGSIDVKQHPPVWNLTPQHLTLAQENQANFQVILAPYGLNGTLTGNSYRETDQSAHKILEEWGRFYPLNADDLKDDASRPPPLVEVIVAGVRMKYPSCYVFLCDSEESPARAAPLCYSTSRGQSGGQMTPPVSPENLVGGETGIKILPSLHYSGNPSELNTDIVANTANAFSIQIRNRVSQDNCVTSGIVKRSTETYNDSNVAGVWEFNDPTAKTNCNCLRHRANKAKQSLASHGKGPNTAGTKHQKGENPEKLDRQQSRVNRSLTSFHRRAPLTDDLLQFDMMGMMPQVQPLPPPTANFSSTASANVLPQLNEGVGVESPSPAAPSPLDEPHSQTVVNPSVDPTMPKLSPHPPAEETAEKEVGAAVGKPAAESVINGGVDNVAKPTENASSVSQKALTDSVFSPNSWPTSQGDIVKNSNVNSWISSQQRQIDSMNLKRPVLPSKDCEQDELVTNALYSFEQVNVWNNFPVKKARVEGLYLANLMGSQVPHDPRQNSMPSPAQKNHKPSTPQPSAPDIYEFSDEASINPSPISTRSFRSSRDDRSSFSKMEDDKDPSRHNSDSFMFPDRASHGGESLGSPPETPNPVPTPSLTHEYDLRPTQSDLDHIFDDSDNEDPFTSPSVVAEKATEEKKFPASLASAVISDGSIAASELMRMYPTPPSNPESCHDTAMEVSCVEIKPVIKSEIFQCGSNPVEDFSRDWSYVYNQPTAARFDMSSKYSPVDLPSANGQLSPIQQPPDYKASWQFQMPIMEKPNPTSYINVPSIENIPSLSSRMPSSAVAASPAPFQNSVGQQRTPMSYELQSPASNASSYLNKTLNSIDNSGTNNQMPEVHSLIVNITLSDSRLNLFRDYNFDSCNICVCQMSIKGVDVGLYMPDPSGAPPEPPERCSCGFSAVVNRRVGHNAGLFYEDEVEITGIRDDRYDQRKPSLLAMEYQQKDNNKSEDFNQMEMELLLGQFTMPYSSFAATDHMFKLWLSNSSHYSGSVFDLLQLQDGNEVSYQALDQGRQAMEHCPPCKLDDPHMKKSCLHKWQFLQGAGRIPQNSQDSVRLLKTLQPLLQDAIQNSRVTRLWEHTYKLSGPLTWKEFHQLAGRGADENSAPQPIPSFLVGYDRDWLSVSPHALHFWDKQFLEPYGKPRDIAYVVLSPENDYIVNAVKLFFKELSTVYGMSKMGRHCPASKVLRDGIMRVGRKAAETVVNESVDEWFTQIGDSPVAEKLRLYAKVCLHRLSPYLSQNMDMKSLFEPTTTHRPGYKTPDSSAPIPTPASSVPNLQSDHSTFNVPTSQANSSEDKENSTQENGEPQKDMSFGRQDDEDENTNCPALVIYIVNPFTYGHEWDSSLDRLVHTGLLKCYQALVKTLPPQLQQNINLQMVPLKTILENTEKGSNTQLLKSMSFSVFNMCGWNLVHTVMGRSLTGFGPAAAADRLLKKKEVEKNRLYSPPFILAPTKDKQAILAESTCGEKIEKSNVLFCVYCLSEDQRWLLGVCTDECGELMETCTINIEIPNRNRRRKASARKIGLKKYWDFILGVVSVVASPCRLVISRFGRIGHGEMKGWSGLLSKKNIMRVSKQVKESCVQCSLLSSTDVPGVVSACLVSLEAQPSFHIMADAVKLEEKMSSKCPLQTPRDTSVTHILVFPTSAKAQANSSASEPSGGMDIVNHNLMEDNILECLETDFNADTDEDLSFLNLFESLKSDPLPNIPGSPTGMDTGHHPSIGMNDHSSIGQNMSGSDPQDEPTNLLQQPLAMGYYLSTARHGPLPRWFWSSAPENENHTLSCFKAALHVHNSQKHDDFMQSTQNRNSHPLDSGLTCDVLRYVLENFNSLSWLTYDVVENDRQSCLPIHFVVLLQMYHALNAFV